MTAFGGTVSKHLDNMPRAGNPHAAANTANAALLYNLSRALTAGGITTATVTSQVKTVNTITFTVNGVFYSKAATDNLWTLSGTVVAASSWQKYLLLLDTAGTATIQEGLQSTVSAAGVLWTNISSSTAFSPFMDTIDSTKAIVGVVTVATDATHTFTPGTTLLGAAGITATFIDGIDQSILPLNGNPVGSVYGQI